MLLYSKRIYWGFFQRKIQIIPIETDIGNHNSFLFISIFSFLQEKYYNIFCNTEMPDLHFLVFFLGDEDQNSI